MAFLPETLRDETSHRLVHEIFRQLLAATDSKVAQKSMDEVGAAIGSGCGTKRKRNEDRAVLAQIPLSHGEGYTVVIVCDGVGSSEMGDVAATLAISTALAFISRQKRYLSIGDLLTQVVYAMDSNVRHELDGRGTTTASILLMSKAGQFAATNIGDSRIFAWNPASSFEQVSVDDTMENELRNLPVRDPSALEARGMRGALSQAIGERGRTAEDLHLRMLYRKSLPRGVVLCTDGAWKGQGDAFNAVCKNAGTATDVVRKVMLLSSWTGGVDNASIVAIENISQLAKTSAEVDVANFDGAHISVWTPEGKIVIREIESAIFRDRKAHVSALKSDVKKTKKKVSEKKTMTLFQSEGSQLRLPVDKDLAPKIEVSSGEEPRRG